MDNQTQEMIDLLREQNQLLKKHLWRLRFSLTSLLLLTTVSCLILGYFAYLNFAPSSQSPGKTTVVRAVPAPATSFATDLPQYYRMVAPQLESAQRHYSPTNNVDLTPDTQTSLRR